MHTTYYDEDDILVIHLCDKPICREVSQDWNTHISYAEDGSTVEIILLEARARGAYPFMVVLSAMHHAPNADIEFVILPSPISGDILRPCELLPKAR